MLMVTGNDITLLDISNIMKKLNNELEQHKIDWVWHKQEDLNNNIKKISPELPSFYVKLIGTRAVISWEKFSKTVLF